MAAVDLKCMTPQCDKIAEFRGICCSCYAVCKQMIDAGDTNWRELEKGGVCHSNSQPMTDAIKAIKGRKPVETVYELDQTLHATMGDGYNDPSYLKRQVVERNQTISQLRQKIQYLEQPLPEAVAQMSLKIDELKAELGKKTRDLAAARLELKDFRKETQERVDSLGEQVLRHIKTIEVKDEEAKEQSRAHGRTLDELHKFKLDLEDLNMQLEQAKLELSQTKSFYTGIDEDLKRANTQNEELAKTADRLAKALDASEASVKRMHENAKAPAEIAKLQQQLRERDETIENMRRAERLRLARLDPLQGISDAG